MSVRRTALSIVAISGLGSALLATSPVNDDTDEPLPTYFPREDGPDLQVVEDQAPVEFELVFEAVREQGEDDPRSQVAISFQIDGTASGSGGPAALAVTVGGCGSAVQPTVKAWAVDAVPEQTVGSFTWEVLAPRCDGGELCETRACVSFAAETGAADVSWVASATGGAGYSTDATLELIPR